MKARGLIYALAVSTAVLLLYGCPEPGNPYITKTSLKAGGLILKVNDATAASGAETVLKNIILDGTLVLGKDFTLSITQRPPGANKQSVLIDNSAGALKIADIADTGDSGTYRITATGIGDYTYTLEDTFELTISPKTPLSDTDLSLKINPISVQIGQEATHNTEIAGTLSAETDYTLSIAAPPKATDGSVTINNEGEIATSLDLTVADSGIYTITATGKGLYTGTVSASFLIAVTGITTQNIADNMTLDYDDKTIDVWTEGSHSLTTLNAGGLTAGLDYFMVIDGPAKDDVVSISHDGEITISDAIEVGDSGTYTVTITGANNYTGSFVEKFTLTVLPRDITTADITLEVADFAARAGETMFHDVTVGGALQASKDYTLSIAAPQGVGDVASIVNESSIFFNATLALGNNGTYTVTATGTGNYNNSISTTFEVTVTRSLSLAGFTLVVSDEAKKMVTAGVADTYGVTVGRRTLTSTDYTLSISGPGSNLSITDNDDGTATVNIGDTVTAVDDAGTYTVLAEGTGNYTGSVSVQFVLSVVDAANTTALDANILDIEIDANVTVKALTESTLKATITGSLTAGTDYLLSIVDVSTSLVPSVMTIADDGTITISSKVGVDDAGQYKILAIGINGYTGTVEKQFEMAVEVYPLVDVEGFSINADNVEMTARTAKSYSNFITVSMATLIPGTDYDLEIQGPGQAKLTIVDNLNGMATITALDTLSVSDAGSYSIKAVGKDNYVGEIISGNFDIQINPRDIDSLGNWAFSATATDVYALTSRSYPNVVSVGAGLVSGTDYTLSISNRPSGADPAVLYVESDGSITATGDVSAGDMGEYTITLTARNDYSGTKDTLLNLTLEELDFTTIDGYSLVSRDIGLSASTAAQYINVVSIGNIDLRPGVDYSMAITTRPAGSNSDAISIDNSGTVSATDALAATDEGTYTVTVTGLGVYTGSASVTFDLTVN